MSLILDALRRAKEPVPAERPARSEQPGRRAQVDDVLATLGYRRRRHGIRGAWATSALVLVGSSLLVLLWAWMEWRATPAPQSQSASRETAAVDPNAFPAEPGARQRGRVAAVPPPTQPSPTAPPSQAEPAPSGPGAGRDLGAPPSPEGPAQRTTSDAASSVPDAVAPDDSIETADALQDVAPVDPARTVEVLAPTDLDQSEPGALEPEPLPEVAPPDTRRAERAPPTLDVRPAPVVPSTTDPQPPPVVPSTTDPQPPPVVPSTTDPQPAPVVPSTTDPRPPFGPPTAQPDVFAQAVYYHRAGGEDEALRHYQTLLNRGERAAEAHNNRGLIFRGRQQTDRALEEFRAAIALDPTFSKAHNNLGVVLLREQRVDEAMTQFRAAIDADEANVDAVVNLALAQRSAGFTEAARATLISALRLDPLSAPCHYNLALVYEEGGDLTRAVEHFQSFLKYGSSSHASLAAAVRDRLATLDARAR